MSKVPWIWRETIAREDMNFNEERKLLDLPDEPTLIYIGQLLDNSIKPTNLSLVNLLKLTQLNLLIMSPETSVGAAIGVHNNSELRATISWRRWELRPSRQQG